MREDTMKKILWILAAAGAALLAAAALLAGEDPQKGGEAAARKEAEQAARSWLALVDSGQYRESWNRAAGFFQKQISPEQWEKTVGGVRDSIGKLVSRKPKSAQFTRTLPGAPDGEYVVIQYDSSFVSKREAVETVVPMKDRDGSWRVSGYFVK